MIGVPENSIFSLRGLIRLSQIIAFLYFSPPLLPSKRFGYKSTPTNFERAVLSSALVFGMCGITACFYPSPRTSAAQEVRFLSSASPSFQYSNPILPDLRPTSPLPTHLLPRLPTPPRPRLLRHLDLNILILTDILVLEPHRPRWPRTHPSVHHRSRARPTADAQ